MKKKNICVFASGNGSNMEHIYNYFSKSDFATVNCVVCNNPKAGLIKRAERLQLPLRMIDRSLLYDSDILSLELKELGTDLIVLAGFLWLIPAHLLAAFPGRIVNIHPALLPAHGGKGMYGMHIHETVLKSGDPVSGITIHIVNERYDEGDILFQTSIAVLKDESAEQLAERIHTLEYAWYPKIIEKLLMKLFKEQ